jgi:hypothetical protein
MLLECKVGAPPVGVVFTDTEVVPGLEVSFDRGVVEEEGGVCGVCLILGSTFREG